MEGPDPDSTISNFRKPHEAIRVAWADLMERGFPEPGDTWVVGEVDHNKLLATLVFAHNQDETDRKQE